jgi:hypothetical protein
MSRETKLESRPTGKLSVALVEPDTLEPPAGVKKAVSRAVAAANDVRQTTVTLWPIGATDTPAHPLIASPRFVNAIAPDGNSLLTLDVTVAIKVTMSFATGAFGDATSVVVLDAVLVGGGGGCGGGLGGLGGLAGLGGLGGCGGGAGFATGVRAGRGRTEALVGPVACATPTSSHHVRTVERTASRRRQLAETSKTEQLHTPPLIQFLVRPRMKPQGAEEACKPSRFYSSKRRFWI